MTLNCPKRSVTLRVWSNKNLAKQIVRQIKVYLICLTIKIMLKRGLRKLMGSLTAFFAQNVERLENKKIVVSKRFKDEKGKPIEWEIKPVSCTENDELQRRATVAVPVAGQRGVTQRQVDPIKYSNLLLTASVVYPDLNNAELQDSYGVKSPEALIGKMLYLGERNYLLQEITKLSQLDADLGEAVTEAKN